MVNIHWKSKMVYLLPWLNEQMNKYGEPRVVMDTQNMMLQEVSLEIPISIVMDKVGVDKHVNVTSFRNSFQNNIITKGFNVKLNYDKLIITKYIEIRKKIVTIELNRNIENSKIETFSEQERQKIEKMEVLYDGDDKLKIKIDVVKNKLEDLAGYLNIDILEIIENGDIITTLPDSCGVYVIYTIFGEYIGSTKNIKYRIRCHKLKQYIKTLNVFVVKEPFDALILEELLIYYIKPKLNKYIPNIDRQSICKL